MTDRPLRPICNERPDDLKSWFPDRRPEPAPDLFEIGLVLAGGQSAGCYLAGVVDFLFEALDCWRDALRDNPALPNHRVRINIIVGASAGGLNAALAAICARYRGEPARQVAFDKRDENLASPFYRAWVRDIDIGFLLQTDDLEEPDGPFSLLNSMYLDAKTKSYIDFGRQDVQVRTDRDWLDDPLPVKITISNLEGVPFEIRFTSGGKSSLWMSLHRDHLAFLRPISNAVPVPAIADHDVLPVQNSAGDPAWSRLGDAVLATVAFPFALQQRNIARPSTDYDYRYVFPFAPGGLVYAQGFPGQKPQQVRFVTIDGGTLNDRPIDLAHASLAGAQGHNARDGEHAHRAILLVDPFPAPPRQQSAARAATLPSFIGKIWRAFIDQGRFDPIDISLAEADDVYSRFLIAPSRRAAAGKIEGNAALASRPLGNFMGYFSEHYRHHDFMLGRRNCQKFLRDWFVLPSRHGETGVSGSLGNDLFAGWPTAALQNPAYRSSLHLDHRQIIPLVGSAARPLDAPVWPARKFAGYASVEAGVKRRVDALWPQVRDQIVDSAVQNSLGRWFARLALNLYFRLSGRRRLLDTVGRAVDAGRDTIDGA